jgi:hypothetical protein
VTTFWIKVLLAALLVGGATTAFLMWKHGIERTAFDAGREQVIAQWNAANAKVITERAAERDRMQKEKDDALREAAQREKRLRTDLAGVGAERDGLQRELAESRSAIGTASIEALRKRVAALTDVFEDCTRRYIAVAEKADRHAADALMFENAWPNL